MAKQRKVKRANATGRTERVERFWMLTFSMARSPAFRSLSGPAVKLFIELRCRFDGENNGKLHLSYREAAKLLGLGKATINRAFDELQDRGFLRKTRQGARQCRLASEWMTTDQPAKEGEPATNDWRRWQGHVKNKTSVPQRNHRGSDGSATEPMGADCSATEPILTLKRASDGSATEPHLHSTMRSSESASTPLHRLIPPISTPRSAETIAAQKLARADDPLIAPCFKSAGSAAAQILENLQQHREAE